MIETLVKSPSADAGAGLCPAGGSLRTRQVKKEGAHGGTMGSPMLKELTQE
jgi:hypothetical protein